MKKNKQYSITSAKNALAMFFSNGDKTTPEEIFQLPERADKSADNNAGYLYNKLTILRHFDLVETKKAPDDDGTFRIVEIKLTKAGKDLLAAAVHDDVAGNDEKIVLLEDIVRAIKEFQRQNPSLAVQFNVEMKKETDVTTE